MRDQEVLDLGRAIAQHLDGWEYREKDEIEHRAYFVKGGMQFSVTRDWQKKTRVNVTPWAWPKYTKMEGGEVSTTTVTPRDLWSPQESGSRDISCAMARGAEAIAKEITRRFLPEYERVYARCFDKAAESQAYEDKARSGWVRICEALGVNPNCNMHYIDAGKRSITIENRNGTPYIYFYAESAEQAIAAVEAVRNAEVK